MATSVRHQVAPRIDTGPENSNRRTRAPDANGITTTPTYRRDPVNAGGERLVGEDRRWSLWDSERS